MTEPVFKKCATCGDPKFVEDFWRKKASADGRDATCKACHKEKRDAKKGKPKDDGYGGRRMLGWEGVIEAIWDQAVDEAAGGPIIGDPHRTKEERARMKQEADNWLRGPYCQEYLDSLPGIPWWLEMKDHADAAIERRRKERDGKLPQRRKA